jgi:hypothetical protein
MIFVMAPGRLFELRTYQSAPGKHDALIARFRDHTLKAFAKHGMDLVGFWETLDDDGTKSGKVVYLLAFESREAATFAWSTFRDDADWAQARADSEKDGPLAISVDSVFMTRTDYSPLL